MKQIEILGSCVTRDAFELPNSNQFKPTPYYARSSLISLYSPPLNINLEGIQIQSNFQQKTVYNDLNSNFSKNIETSESDFLIIDFIDERFDIGKCFNSFFTLSNEFNQSNMAKILVYETLEKNVNYFELWEMSALKFIHQIKRVRRPKSVILHKAYWLEKYLDKNGEIKNFPDRNKIILNNKRLERMYTFVERNLPGIIRIIDLKAKANYVASENHKWGLSSFHYEDKYYEDFIEELKAINDLNL